MLATGFAVTPTLRDAQHGPHVKTTARARATDGVEMRWIGRGLGAGGTTCAEDGLGDVERGRGMEEDVRMLRCAGSHARLTHVTGTTRPTVEVDTTGARGILALHLVALAPP